MYLSFNSFVVSSFTSGIMVSFISVMPRFFWSIWEASTITLFKLARDKAPCGPVSMLGSGGERGPRITVVNKINQALRSANSDPRAAFLQEGYLLLKLEVLGELEGQTAVAG